MATKKAVEKPAEKSVTFKLNAEGNLDVMVGEKKVGVVRVSGPRK